MRFATTCRRSHTCLRIHALSFAHVCSASPGCIWRQYTFAAVRGYETGPREDHLSQEGDYPPQVDSRPQARFSVLIQSSLHICLILRWFYL